MIKKKQIFIHSLLVVNAFFFIFSSSTYPVTCKTHDAAYLIGSNDNSIFTKNVLDEVASCAGIVVLNTPLERGDEEKKSLKLVIKELHRRRKDLPVLIYSWCSIWYERGRPRVGWEISEGLPSKKKWLLEKRLDKNKKLVVIPDIRIREYQDWFVENVIKTVNEVGANGVMVDLAFRSPDILIQRCKSNSLACLGYKESFDNLFYKLKERLYPHLLYFNGIFSENKVSLSDQLALLDISDGAVVEFFGMKPRTASTTFERDILFYLKELPKFPHKKFLIFGRSPWNRDKSDQHWRQYLYAAYKMFSNNNTLYKYQASFQVPSKQLSGGLYLMPELTRSMGDPIEKFSITDTSLYTRKFTNGFIAFCRQDAEQPVTVILPGPMYSFDGHAFSDAQEINPGEALILYREHITQKDK